MSPMKTNHSAISTNPWNSPVAGAWVPRSRRDFLLKAGGGFGAVAMAAMTQGALRLQGAPGGDVGPRLSHFPGKAKNIIFVFLQGGPSHLDLFDPKPLLNQLAGQRIPPSYKRVLTPMGEFDSPLLGTKRTFQRHGQSGIWTSDWIPHISGIVDDIAVIRSVWGDGLNHVGSVCQMNTGSILAGRPSLGAWASYGLGSENDSLPSFVVLLDRPARVHGGSRNWGAGFLPATYQGTALDSGETPIRNLFPEAAVSESRRRRQRGLLGEINAQHLHDLEQSDAWEARINAYELAYRMQSTGPEAVDLSTETETTKRLYGLDQEPTKDMARSLILARRLVERGVRFVQVYSGAGNRWDSHSSIEKNHSSLCLEMDQPVAALVRDLKARGLLDETLVVWGGEFGRTPQSEKGDGRDHNPTGFTMWMAGGGVQGGQTIGSTDDLGLHAVDERAHVRDVHATMLAAMGIDPMALTTLHNGRLENPVANTGAPIDRFFTG